jgi:urease accessory protein
MWDPFVTGSPFVAWQLIDSAFPTGAFAHSWGLEAAWHQGEVADAEALGRYVEWVVEGTAWTVVPLVNAAYASLERVPELDELAHAFLTNEVANRASRQQGRTLLATAVRVWPPAERDRLTRQAAGPHRHLGPTTGAVLRIIGVPLPTARQLVLYGAARGVLSAAVRLGILGSYEAQRLQLASAPWLETQCRRCADLGEDDLAQIAPLPDLFQATHDRLYSRLFQS